MQPTFQLGGFVHSTLAKLVIFGVVLSAALCGFFHVADSLVLDGYRTLARFELWRLFTYHFVTRSPSEFLFAVTLLYIFRSFERLMGSRKFAALALFSGALATALNLVVIVALSPVFAVELNGPFALVFSCLIFYWSKVPSTTHFSLFGFQFSEKTFTYLFAFQLIVCRFPESVVGALTGTAAGLIYYVNLFGVVEKFNFPPGLVIFMNRYFMPFVGSSPRRSPPRRMAPHHVVHPRPRPTTGEPQPAQPIRRSFDAEDGPVPVPREQDVEAVIALGFNRAEALSALASSFNNVEVAVNKLLEDSK